MSSMSDDPRPAFRPESPGQTSDVSGRADDGAVHDPVLKRTASGQAFVRTLLRWVTPGRKGGDLVERLVLAFSRLAVLLSTLGLMYGGWVSVERWQARQQAAADRQQPATDQKPPKQPATQQGAMHQEAAQQDGTRHGSAQQRGAQPPAMQ